MERPDEANLLPTHVVHMESIQRGHGHRMADISTALRDPKGIWVPHHGVSCLTGEGNHLLVSHSKTSLATDKIEFAFQERCSRAQSGYLMHSSLNGESHAKCCSP